MKKYLLLTIIFPLTLSSQSFVPNAPELDLKSYILIEPNTNTIIAEFNSSDLIEPASMTKVMTSYVIADQIDNDLIDPEDEVFISNSIIGIQSVNLIEDFQFQKRSLTERIKIAYESVTQDSKSWTCI